MERIEKLKAFDETKAGVKGLTDSGLMKIPDIFVRPSEEIAAEEFTHNRTQIQVPVIDLTDVQKPDRRKQIVEEVRIASETWGFFQVVNHGIPQTVLDGMIEGVRQFHEQDVEEKMKYYSRDIKKMVRFSCNYDLFESKTANWRDTLSISIADQIDPQELPASCRVSSVEYSKHVKILGNNLLGLLSEALGLETDHLENMECSKGHSFHGHYYPACPEPELAIGTTKHSDLGFLTILLQNQIISSLQLVSNGKFKSCEHRVIASRIGPRISVACFFRGPVKEAKIYGPIEELISEENPAIYREVSINEYAMKFLTTGLDNYRALDYYKV
ncbi:hypothetical protein BUALT_Bualt14G0112200 [Buddleja alternifolia]|uniref:Deacetoxyvindoline 4-hydroxylase n=1 Tax=Buddleja alternifolia TaxID=168488 RepID=A0AAV6WPP0_9LAMI|nr:hypothetical protein BUALT_Bualt14G0112200 [Buddleja alternifolia]